MQAIQFGLERRESKLREGERVRERAQVEARWIGVLQKGVP